MELLMTYEQYVSFGGTVDEVTFNSLVKRAQMKLNYLTNNRISKLTTIPSEVYEVLVEMIGVLNTENKDRDPSLTSYSNGIETYGYSNSKDGVSIDSKLSILVSEYLSAYPELLYRGRWQWKQE